MRNRNQRGAIAEAAAVALAVAHGMRITLEEFLPQAGHRALPDRDAASTRIASAACWR